MATKQRDPAHYLHAIALLAYLAADDDGPITVADDPDEARRGQRETLLGIRDDADRAEPDLHESEARSALALVSAAIDLLDAAEVDARGVASREVERRLRKAGRHLMGAAEALGAVARIEALEIEVARPRVPVGVARIKAAALPDEVAALTIDAVEAPPEPDKPEAIDLTQVRLTVGGQPITGFGTDDPIVLSGLADLPVGTITVYAPLGMVRVRLPDGWDLAVGPGSAIYNVGPAFGFEPGSDEDVVRLGDGAVPDSWLESHAEVAEIARAWLAERASLPEPPATAPPASTDTDTDTDTDFPF